MDEDDELDPWEADDDLDDVTSEVVAYDPDGDVELDVAPQTGAGLFDPPAEAEDEPAAAVPAPPTPVEPVEALALYRRYRPDTFAQIVGQEHVTAPLQRALANNRVNHAYLFSGPRGCGKTTSARILARALNCENGPAPEPCGHCRSCRDLATGGPGSIDVIEIDAASHGGVDDARDLRERAFFAPVASRYKIYIIDEAHMVTTQGFNALLKLVEEPPPHVKFIFATTEPDKVIGTIRSRTHHYPFRLVPPKVLTHYLAGICEQEGITVDQGVLPLVVRAGGGSVRDSLSVLDQLLGGASDQGVTYDHATGLLGYTPESLLDEMIDAFAAGEGAGVFSAVDKVIEAGQDPRRFAEDLLGRLRDLVIVAAVPDALSSGLVDVSPEQGESYTAEARAMGLGELTRAADVIAQGLTQMRGTTAPRLHLELMCARVLLPGADVTERGINARLDRIERRLNLGGLDTGGPVVEAPRAGGGSPSPEGERRPRGRRGGAETPTAETPTTPPATVPAAVPVPAAAATPVQAAPSARSVRPERPTRPERPRAARPDQVHPEPVSPSPSPSPSPARQRAATAPGGRGLSTQDAQARWGEVLDAVGARRQFTKVLLEGNAAVVSLVNNVLTVALSTPGARAGFDRPREREVFQEAVAQVFGTVVQVETLIDADAVRQLHSRRAGSPPVTHRGAPAAPAAPGAGAASGADAQQVAPPRAEPPRPRQRGARGGRSSGPAGPDPVHRPAHDDAPPPLDPPDDPWDEPPPEEDPYGGPYGPPRMPRSEPATPVADTPAVSQTAPASTAEPADPPATGARPAPAVQPPTAPRTAVSPPVAPSPVAPPRASRYSQVAAAPPPPRDLTPEEEAGAYADDDETVGEGYESAAELLTNVLGAELLLEEQQDTGLGA